MKKTLKLTGKALLASLLFSGGIAMAETGVDATYQNMTLEERLYLYDGYGSKWGLDAGNDGLWFVAERPIDDTYSAAVKIRNVAAANTLVVGGTTSDTEGYVGIGTDAPTASLHAVWSGSNTVDDGLQTMALLSANNTASGKSSDAGFGLINKKLNFQWNFRTYGSGEGFTATKLGTGGGEFVVQSPTTNYRNTKVIMGGVTVFENGHLVTASSRSLKTDIKPLDAKAAMDAFHKLQPVSYAYKAHKDEPVVGFIAEDVPELVAMPSRKSFDSAEVVAVLTKVVQEQDKILAETRNELKVAQEKIAKLETMQKRLARVESLLINLALDTSKTTKEKISLK